MKCNRNTLSLNPMIYDVKCVLYCVKVDLNMIVAFWSPVFLTLFALFCPLLICIIQWNPSLSCFLAVGLTLDLCSATRQKHSNLTTVHKSKYLLYNNKIKNDQEWKNQGFWSYFLRNWTQSWWPYISAILTGLSPQQSSLSIGAWKVCSSCSTARWPDSAAKWAGLHPFPVLGHGLAPFSMRIWTILVCPVEEG